MMILIISLLTILLIVAIYKRDVAKNKEYFEKRDN
jgi:hypothetical protein